MATFTVTLTCSHRTLLSEVMDLDADSAAEAAERACAALHRWAEYDGLSDFDISEAVAVEAVSA